MRIRKVGASELEVSAVGVGCNNFGWRLDAEATRAVVDAAVDVGITLFDTAESYGDGESERFLGRALEGRRDRAVIATKFGWGGGRDDHSVARGHPDHVRAAIDASLERLGTDHVDLYQYHRPDGVTPIAETLGAMNELVEAGKVRFIGSSNLSAAQVEEADAVAAELGIARFVSAQNEYSWLERGVEDDLLPACERLGIGFIPYFPLASGLLTGKYRRGAAEPSGTRLSGRLNVSDEKWSRIEALEAFAADRGVGLLDVAIGGLAAQPAVCSVIAGAMTPEQVRANAAAGEWEPSVDELAQLVSL
ncbi:MAG TPA: aldo/keto reductase [Gaiellaceae bacterium]|jgi:aryl-alcohol dehydrogenase-like predicted oxidoreductase|nr:aldo/keto reductase [Gaiellaceae bacterium]